MAGTTTTGDGVSAFTDIEKEILASTDAFVEKTVVLSGDTEDDSGTQNATLDPGYLIVRVKSSGSGATASDVDKFREFDDSQADLDEIQDIAILASKVELNNNNDLQVACIVMGLVDADDTYSKGSFNLKNNHRLHEWPL